MTPHSPYSGSSGPDADARLRALLNVSPDGMIVVDAEGRVCLVNAAAEALLRLRAEELAGLPFGLPMLLGEVAEISLLQPEGDLRAAEMRTLDISWADEPAHLIMLRDLTEQRRAQEALRDAEGFSRAILNSLYQHIAVLDARGTIVLVNDAWRQFAIENGDPQLRASGVGANYFAVCADAGGVDAAEAPAVLAGMRRVLGGELPFFEIEYPCNSPDAERWFHMRVVPLQGQQPGLVITHTDITVQRRAADEAADARALREQLQARERELQAVGAISGAPRARPAAPPDVALRVAHPERFQSLVARYAALLDESFAARGFEVPDHEGDARQMAADLGGLGAVARDVVEIYLAALHARSAAAPRRQQVYLEEGRVLALQVMGYLAGHYRERALSG